MSINGSLNDYKKRKLKIVCNLIVVRNLITDIVHKNKFFSLVTTFKHLEAANGGLFALDSELIIYVHMMCSSLLSPHFVYYASYF